MRYQDNPNFRILVKEIANAGEDKYHLLIGLNELMKGWDCLDIPTKQDKIDFFHEITIKTDINIIIEFFAIIMLDLYDHGEEFFERTTKMSV